MSEIERWRLVTDDALIVNAAMAAGVEDVDAFQKVYPWKDRIQQFTPVIRKLGLSTFATAVPTAMGRIVDPTLLTRLPICAGDVTTIAARPLIEAGGSGVRIDGRVDGKLASTFDLRSLLVVDDLATVIGVGYVSQQSKKALAWTAFARPRNFAAPATILAVADDTITPVCRLGAATISAAKLEQFISFSELRRPLDQIPISFVGSWSNKGINSAAHPLPVAGQSWGSWAGDEATGTLTMGPLSLPADSRDLVLPVVVGPVTAGLHLRILAGVDRMLIREVDLAQMTPHQWRAVVIGLPSAALASEIVIEATDNGTGWGQWFGIGPPFILP